MNNMDMAILFIKTINYATLVHSGYINQTFNFLIKANNFSVFLDFSKCLIICDPDDLTLYISPGLSLENFFLKQIKLSMILKLPISQFPDAKICYHKA